jgi:uncharacterized protein YegL|tara:strand:- start:552 stop:1223 length:672 start_codon:yes stop_codon:yes gene_type:complete
MKNNKTHITVLLDRSGSMEQIRGETIDGFNALLNEQQQQTGAADLTLVQFDAEDPFEIIHRSLPLAQVPRLSWETYVPRSGTPLLDAIGYGIRNIEKNLSKNSDSDRPDKIIVAIITDGQENSSRRYHKKKVSQMIEKKQGVGWQFAFLSADMASINDALDYGINPHSTMSYDKTHQGTTKAWNSISSAISSYRQGRRRDVSFLDEAKSSSGSTPDLNSLQNN